MNKKINLPYICLRQFLVLFCGIALWTGCSDDDKEPQVTLNESSITLNTSETFQLIAGNADGYTLVWYSSNKNVATVTKDGLVSALSDGTARITADIGYSKAVCEVRVKGKSVALSLDALSTPLSDAIVYSKNIKLKAPYRVMQNFDIDSKGNIYYIQIGTLSSGTQGVTKAHELYVIKAAPNSSDISDYMTFRYFGHGSNIAIEEAEDGEVYVWISGNASKNQTTFEYENSQTFSRIKYEKGKVYDQGYGGETFYLNNGKLNTHPALDIANDRICISATQGGKRYFYTYKLSQIRALKDKQFEITVTYGGEEKDVNVQTVQRKFMAKDLSEVKPLGLFEIAKGSNQQFDLNSHSLQGFDIDNNCIYFNEGDGNGNLAANGHSNDYVTVLDLSGNIIRPRTPVTALVNMDALKSYGITDTGYMEGEGIKIKGSKIYMGFASRRDPSAAGGDDFRRANIFVYDCSK